jgi:hypothetical protein
MPNSKILNMFHLLTNALGAKVEKLDTEPKKGEQPTLIITLTNKGVRETFNSKSDDFRQLIVTLARKDFNEPFTESNLRELNQMLEGIAIRFQPDITPEIISEMSS